MSASDPDASNRRHGPADRRQPFSERRNEDRLAEELSPRRDPEIRGRRSGD